MKNVDLIYNLNSSAGAQSEGLRQEDQSLNLQMILLLPNWSMEDPGKTLQSSERHGVLQRNMDRWKSKWRTVELASAVKPITLATWDQVWKLQVLTHPGTSCFHGDLVFFTSLLLYKLALLSSYSSSIHPALPPTSRQMTSNLQTVAPPGLERLSVVQESVSVC